MSKYTGKIQI